MLIVSYLDGVPVVRLPTLIIDDGDVIVADVQLLGITVWIIVSGRHQSGYVEDHLMRHPRV